MRGDDFLRVVSAVDHRAQHAAADQRQYVAGKMADGYRFLGIRAGPQHGADNLEAFAEERCS